jgi:hypothetical protein
LLAAAVPLRSPVKIIRNFSYASAPLFSSLKFATSLDKKNPPSPRIETLRQFTATLRHRLFPSVKKGIEEDAHPVLRQNFPTATPSSFGI